MKKLERILKLAELKQGPGHLTVREMSQACGVSQRTVFRYLRTLSELGLGLGLPFGAGKPRPDSMAARLHPDDLSLLSYALDHNPLAGHEYFARRFMQIRKLAAVGQKPLRASPHGLFEIRTVKKATTNTAATALLSAFGRLRGEPKPVRLHLRGQKRPVSDLIPKSIRLQGGSVYLVFRDRVSGRVKSFALDMVRRLEPGRTRRRPGRTRRRPGGTGNRPGGTGNRPDRGRIRSRIKKG